MPCFIFRKAEACDLHFFRKDSVQYTDIRTFGVVFKRACRGLGNRKFQADVGCETKNTRFLHGFRQNTAVCSRQSARPQFDAAKVSCHNG